jgi:hypothetical protein
MGVAIVPAVIRFSDIDTRHYTLGTKVHGRPGNQVRIIISGTVDGNLVGSGPQQSFDMTHFPDPSSDGKRHKTVTGKLGNRFIVRFTIFPGSGNVQNNQFIHFPHVIYLHCRKNGSDPSPAVKRDTLDQAEILPEKSGYDSCFQQNDSLIC